NLANRSLVDDVLKKVDGLKPIADELGVPLSQLAIAWCAANPNVSSVITGATKESQVAGTKLFLCFLFHLLHEGRLLEGGVKPAHMKTKNVFILTNK
ncbi:hypothetical protein S83_004524, partial [Arachis hypogaea]